MSFYQIFLPAFSLIYFLQVFVIKSYFHWKKTGNNPFVFSKQDNAHDYIGGLFKFMVLGTWFSIIIYSFYMEQYHFLLPIWYLEYEFLKLTGIILLIISFLWIKIAQIQMSKSWRIGIDYENKTDLVSSGLFRYSRNPIFLGIITSYIGTFLIIPNALSFTLMITTYFIIQIQVRLEEEFLIGIHKEFYQEYKLKVRRWF